MKRIFLPLVFASLPIFAIACSSSSSSSSNNDSPNINSLDADASAVGDPDVGATPPPSVQVELALSPPHLEMRPNSTASVQINVTRQGVAVPCLATLDGLPAGVKAAPVMIARDASSATATLVSDSTVVPGSTARVHVRCVLGIATLALDILGPAGSIDTDYGDQGKAIGTVTFGAGNAHFGPDLHVARQSNGKLVAVGEVYTSSSDFGVARYNEDGTLDTTFGTGGRVATDIGSNTADHPLDVTIQPDGKIIVVGSTGETTGDFAIVRYNADGTLDTSFDTDGKVVSSFSANMDRAVGVAVQADGKIVVAGDIANGTSFLFARYTPDGALDTTFNSAGSVSLPGNYARAMTIQPDGKMIVVGNSGDDMQVVRITSAGILDTTFDSDGVKSIDFNGFIDNARTVTLQSDGKILMLGSAGISSTDERFGIVRLLPNGDLDTTFNTTGKVTIDGPSGDFGRSLAVQADGKILAAGGGVYTGSATDFYIARLTANGELDPTFDEDGRVYVSFGGSTYNIATNLFLLPHGRILAAGFALSPVFAPTFVRLWQ